MGLFTPIWKTKKPGKIPDAIRYVNSREDVLELMNIWENAQLPEIRDSVLNRLIDIADRMGLDSARTILRKIDNEDFRREFIIKMKDPNILTALYSDGSSYSGYVAEYTADQEVLKRMALIRPSNTIFDRISDRDFIISIPKNQKNPDRVRIDALRIIKDDDLIFDIACNDPSTTVRRAAVDMIRDPSKMDIVVEKAYSLAKELSGPGCVPEEEYCAYEFKKRDLLLCSLYDSSRLRYVSIHNNEPLCRVVDEIYGEYSPSISIDGIQKRKHGGVFDYYFEYPDAKVELIDEPIGTDIFICPVCYKFRNPSNEMKCPGCGTEYSAVRIKNEE